MKYHLLQITSVAISDCLLVTGCILSVLVTRSPHTLLSPHLYLDINKLNVAKSFKFVITHLFPGSLFPSFYNNYLFVYLFIYYLLIYLSLTTLTTYTVDGKLVRQWKATSFNKVNNHKSTLVYHK